MISIRTKLSLWLTALVILSTVIGIILFDSMLRQAFHDSIIARLQEDLQEVLLATQVNGDIVTIDQSRLSGFYNPVFSGRYYQLNLPQREIRSRSLWDQQLNIRPLAQGEIRVWQAKGPGNHDMQLLSLGLPDSLNEKAKGTLTVAQDLSIGRKVFSQVYSTKLGINLAMLLAMIAGIFLILRQSFQPINQMQRILSRLREGEISALEVDSIPSELQPLANTYNELLIYSSKQIERSRNNIGNLSHGLKTPLAVMQQQIEVLGLSDPAAADALQQQLDLIHKMIERKLANARITGDMLPAAQMQLPKDLQDLCQTLAKVHFNKDVQCDIDIAAHITRLPLHREDGMELFGNLLDNAYKWTKSRITVQATLEQNKLVLTIEDDGPGVASDALLGLTGRGKRLDEATLGHGLGLSIVKDIAEQYQIGLTFDRSEALGGLSVSLVFKY